MKTFMFKDKPIDITSLAIEGERVILKSIDNSYSSEIFKEFTEEVTRYMLPAPHKKIDTIYEFISRSRKSNAEGNNFTAVIIDKDTGEFLGCCGLHGTDSVKTPLLGIWLKIGAHGKKLGREAIHALAFWAVDNIDFEYLIYPVDRANISSYKIPESLGGVIYEENKVENQSGNILDEVIYKIPYEILKSIK